MLRLASTVWQEGNAIGSKNGWRNAQASVLAPTGTIGFMMDCDTTGIEPDFSLVKFKKLVGGGSMQIVNQTIPRALTKLGYPQETIEAVVEYIAEHGHVVDAPDSNLSTTRSSIVRWASAPISPMGHVRMMAAVQPFLSGAISKTVNMPETASIEEVEEIYFEGWKTGLKALAIYRDNCKVGQPSPTEKADKKQAPADVVVEHRPVRKRLPKVRPSQTISFSVGGAEGYMTAGSYPDDGLGKSSSNSASRVDTGWGDGCVLDCDLHRSAVQGPARGIRVEVREHALRAVWDDRRPGYPDGAVHDGLHLPAVGPGSPAVREARRAGHLHSR